MKTYKFYLIFVLSSILFIHYTSGQQQLASFEKLLQSEFPPDGPGGTAIVAKNGKILYKTAIGKANLELDVPMRTEHIFRIGSITKQFTASAILKLAEEGKLSVQDELTKFIPDYPTHGHSITIEHLLTHTSGIKSYTGMKNFDAHTMKKNMPPTEMVDFFKNEPMDFAPGTQYKYNNSGYFLLGYIIEQISGKSYEEYINENFFQPLAMKNSSYGNTTRIIKNRAAGYQKTEDNYQNANFLSMSLPYSAGSLLSTVEDLSKWYEAVMNDQVISKANREKAHSPYVLKNGKPIQYGYGWSLSDIQQIPSVEHGGGINGFLTYSIYVPEEKLFVAVFSNCTCKPPQEAAIKLAAIALDKPYEWKAITMSEKDLKTYTGVYESAEKKQRILSFEGGNLYSMLAGGERYHIQAFGKDKFFFEDSFTTLKFKRDSKGNIISVVSEGRGPAIKWLKTDKEVPKLSAVDLPEKVLKNYTGKYEFGPDSHIVISMEGKRIFGKPTNGGKLELFPYAQHKFFAKEVDVKLFFEVNDKGEVTGFTLFQNGEHKGKKVEG